jgi:hypothetical protein
MAKEQHRLLNNKRIRGLKKKIGLPKNKNGLRLAEE